MTSRIKIIEITPTALLLCVLLEQNLRAYSEHFQGYQGKSPAKGKMVTTFLLGNSCELSLDYHLRPFVQFKYELLHTCNDGCLILRLRKVL